MERVINLVEQEPTLNLLELIYGLVERLMLTTEFDLDEMHDFVGSVRDSLDEVRAQYDEPAPQGAQAVQELMVESLSLFDESFEEITLFLDDKDEDRLRRAVGLGEDANDILSAVEEVIQNNKHVLAEMAEV